MVQCVDCYTDRYNSKTTSYFDSHVPVIEKKVRILNKNDSWYDSEVRQKKRELRRAEKKVHVNRTDYYINEYKRMRQEKCNLVVKKKKFFYKEKINECISDSKKLYRTLNNLLGKNIETKKQPSYANDKQLANDFKNYFVNKISTINVTFDGVTSSNGDFIPDFPVIGFNTFYPVDETEVLTLLKSLNKTNCLQDPFDIRLLQFDEICDDLTLFFTDIINTSFASGIFPQSGKVAVVRPLLKGNKDPDKLESYRPVHNLSLLSKIIERACLNQLNRYLDSFEPIPKFQSAYRKFHSVETCLCRIYNDMIVSKATGKCSLLILLDLTAAFDTVDQVVLLRDLKLLGIGGIALDWFQSYLKNRKFTVEVGVQSSDAADMVTGIPQGSILAPMLFTVYTIELFYILQGHNVTSHFYADDTQLLLEVTNSEETIEKLELVFESIKKWMSSRKLKLNMEKTECMLIGSNSRLVELSEFSSLIVDGNSLDFKSPVRNLGILFDSTLSMKNQLNNVKKKLFLI